MQLSPFYPSALADGGYDVDDYRDVDPRLGSLADFGELAAKLHAAGIKVIVEELGLQEVADIPAESIQDPAFSRSGGTDKGRDGCRVPLP